MKNVNANCRCGYLRSLLLKSGNGNFTVVHDVNLVSFHIHFLITLLDMQIKSGSMIKQKKTCREKEKVMY